MLASDGDGQFIGQGPINRMAECEPDDFRCGVEIQCTELALDDHKVVPSIGSGEGRVVAIDRKCVGYVDDRVDPT